MCRKKSYTLALALFLSFFAGFSSQAEEMYQISETELTALETNLQTLERNNEKKQNLLAEQKAQLEKAERQLETAEKALSESRLSNARTQKSLEKANQSLNELEREAKRKVQIKTRQRNLWIIISGGLLYCLINKNC